MSRRTRPPRAGAAPQSGPHPISTGEAALVPDDDRRRGWSLVVNGVPSSHVDLDDPLRLDFEYLRWMADWIEVVELPEPGRLLHLGGSACTLARYLAAALPGVRQLVFELDAELVELVRRSFPFRQVPGLKVRVAEARAGLADCPDAGADVVIRDAFAGAEVPGHLTTVEFLAEVRRVLRPGGLYLANVADGAGVALARSEAATALACFTEVALVGEPAQFRGRRYGNVVLAAADAPLPWAALGRRFAGGAVRARLLDTAQVRALCNGHRPRHDPPLTPASGSPPAR